MKTLLAGFLGLALNFHVAAAPVLGVNPPRVSVNSGSSFVIDLQISGLRDGAAPSLGAYDIKITFDSFILDFTGTTFGDQLNIFGLGDISSVTSGFGTINLFELSLESAAALDALQKDSFTLATLSFNTVGVGTSVVDLSVTAMSDANGSPLTVSIIGGSVSSAAPVPEPSMLHLASLGLLALALGQQCRKRFFVRSRRVQSS